MIFVTTGTQEPFDRLLAIVSTFAEKHDEQIIIQAKTNKQFSANVLVHEFLSPKEFDSYFNDAKFVISHAGMGTIISALYKSKPLVIFPRIASLGEHRNEHQMATAKKIKDQGFVHVAFSEDKLLQLLEEMAKQEESRPLHTIGAYASEQLIDSLDTFIQSR